MVWSYLSIVGNWLASWNARLRHLLNYPFHKLTGILQASELLTKLLVEWPERELLLALAFRHRLQSCEEVVSHIVWAFENPILLAVHCTHWRVLNLVDWFFLFDELLHTSKTNMHALHRLLYRLVHRFDIGLTATLRTRHASHLASCRVIATSARLVDLVLVLREALSA